MTYRFKVFYQVGLAGIGGDYCEDMDAISPHKAIDIIKSEHNHVNIVAVLDEDGNILYRGERLW